MTRIANPYYDPEKRGLTILGEIDWDDDCYQYDMTVVWIVNATGELVYGRSSGCSCGSPFEEYQGEYAEPLEPIDKLQDFIDHCNNSFGGITSNPLATRVKGEIGVLCSKVNLHFADRERKRKRDVNDLPGM